MELSAIQIVTTVVLIVAAGAVALVCDYLRNRSQQLRELALELNVRKEVSVATPAAPMIAPSAASAAAVRAARIVTARKEKTEAVIEAPAPAVLAELPTPPVEVKMHPAERHSNEKVKPALASAAELTSVRGAARPRRRPLPPPGAPLPRLDEMNPRQALSEWLDQRAAKTPAKATAPVKMEQFAHAEPARPTLTIVEPAPAAEAPSCASSLEEPEPAPVVLLPLAEPALVVHTPAAQEPAPAAEDDIRPAAEDDIREVLRRALAKRNAQAVPIAVAAAAPRPVLVPAAVPLQAAPVAAAAPRPVLVPAAVPVHAAPVAAAAPAPEPVPAPAAISSPAKTVSVFLSTRRIDTFLRDVPAQPAPQLVREQEVVEALVENIAAAEPRFEIIDGAAPSSNSLEVVLPAGMHDDAVLDRAIATGKPFRGLVVSVGVNDVEGRSANHPDLMHSIGFFIRGLIVENEFACRTGEAEFLIVCPGLQGFAAQRRLNQIAEQLWDYQLRGLSTWSILFSWGGADVHQQRLADAIAMANQQMYQTRRGRKTVSVDSLRPSRKVAM
ncbi:MAG: hypothetical protein ABSF98_12700 [Bryobacteraceae bacterium]|jgi:hypothetical protein